MSARRLALVIPTFRRPALLERLLDDLAGQTRRPDELWIVDGDGQSGTTHRAVDSSAWMRGGGLAAVVASTRANLPFQRYVGRLAAQCCDTLLYFDDDLRLRSEDVVERLAAEVEAGAAAATASISTGGSAPRRSGWAALLGPARRARPGSLTASGTRVPPADDGAPSAPVDWLRGGAMAFRADALPPEEFSTELFELAARGLGLGEELVLASIARKHGEIRLVRGIEIEHPGEEPTRAYATDAFRRGRARGVSRRLLAADGRFSGAALWRAHAGAVAAALLSGGFRGGLGGGPATFRYITGYAQGATERARTGRYCPPSGLDWKREARESLRQCRLLDRRAA